MGKKGYKVYGAAENVAYNYGADPSAAAAKAIDQWIHSPGHEANMVAPNNNMQAAAAVKDDKTGIWYFCQMFINNPGYNGDTSGQTK